MYPEDQLSEDALFSRVCKYHKEKRLFNKMDADVVSHEHCVSIDQNATSCNSNIRSTSPETTCMCNPGDGEQNEMPHYQNKSCLPERANMTHDQGKLYSMLRLFSERHSARLLLDGQCYN